MDERLFRPLGFGFVGGLLGAVVIELLVRAFSPSVQDILIILGGLLVLGALFGAVALAAREK